MNRASLRVLPAGNGFFELVCEEGRCWGQSDSEELLNGTMALLQGSSLPSKTAIQEERAREERIRKYNTREEICN